jgi:hypothetical protein
MMKQLFRAAILVFLVTLFLSAWSLPAGAASSAATNRLVNQGHSSLNASSKGNLAASPQPTRGWRV